jgi:hypothetical protein
MPKTPVNIVADVKQVLSREFGDELVTGLSRLSGVSQARGSASAPRLMLVDYDPKQIDTQRILGTVVHRGFDARLVGM